MTMNLARACKAVLRYPGGKTVGIDVLTRYMPDRGGVLYSPFLGGASVELYLAFKHYPRYKIIANDLSPELYTFWSALKSDRRRVCREARALLGSRDWSRPRYFAVRALVYQRGLAKDKYQAAAAYYLCSHASFNGGIAKLWSEAAAKITKLRARVECLESSEWMDTALSRVRLYNKTYSEFMARVVAPGVAKARAAGTPYFVYLDPPYHVPQNHYGQGHQMRKDVFDHEAFAETVIEAAQTYMEPGTWLVCYNDEPYTRRLFPASRGCKTRRIVYQKGMFPEIIVTSK